MIEHMQHSQWVHSCHVQSLLLAILGSSE